jgi:hypothetical protein
VLIAHFIWGRFDTGSSTQSRGLIPWLTLRQPRSCSRVARDVTLYSIHTIRKHCALHAARIAGASGVSAETPAFYGTCKLISVDTPSIAGIGHKGIHLRIELAG